MSELLKIENLEYKKNDKTILENINLKLNNGHFVGLVGENGAGKTTLLKIISNLNTNYKGNISINGEKNKAKQKLAVSFSDELNSFDKSMKIEKIVRFYLKVYPDFSFSKYLEISNFLKINPKMKLNDLSKGNKEKLIIALCLSREVPLYLLDEPFSGIDLMSRNLIIKGLLKWIDSSATLMISSHHLTEIADILDELVIIKDKRVIKHEFTEEIRSQSISLEKYFEKIYYEDGK
ncbi:ATP-binding cassette domain-containing protein [Companilactobacillus sp. DQM5]|uniref:ATP-binding cassette domain-containing protein n=1 Tax=Companilactobacillus sp. DQM5 TaxID=3463359 RepID=UPI00405835A6